MQSNESLPEPPSAVFHCLDNRRGWYSMQMTIFNCSNWNLKSVGVILLLLLLIEEILGELHYCRINCFILRANITYLTGGIMSAKNNRLN